MKVLGLGHVLPELKRLADVDHPNKLQLEAIKHAGYDKYWVSKHSARKMAAQAVRKALEESGYRPEDIGFIVAGQSNVPDYIQIDFACQVGAELGGLQVKTVNLVEGCGTGISTCLSANHLINDLKPGKIGVIVLVQRVSEPHLDRFGLMNAILTDGAAAAIVGKSNGHFTYKGGQDISDTRFVDMVRIERGGAMNPVLQPNHDTRKDKLGRELIMENYRFSGSELNDFLTLRSDNTINIIKSCMNEAGWAQDGNYILIHTLEGKQGIENLAARFGIPVEKTNADLVSEIGHMGSVDQWISLDVMHSQGRIQSGDKIIMSTISGGMKWGCCLWEKM
jgi:3-oxoacyl-[acyl-carrier-protein] synthase-3